ncbi:MAG: protein kinase domain-containing protein [Planctomycetota bacterium]|jgi:serine/threonine protein kinase
MIVLYYVPEWIKIVRAFGLPEDLPEHQNVSRVLASDLSAPRPWAAWSHAGDQTLADVLAICKYVPLSAAIPIVLQIARGLEALHEAGHSHKDLRRETLTVDPTGRIHLAFANTLPYRAEILRRLRDKDKAIAGDLLSSLKAYLPPEQRKGDVYGMEGDMYAFGHLSFEMLAGEPPDPFELRYLSQRDKRIPKVLNEVVFSSLERRVRARVQNASGLYDRLLEGFRKAGYTIDTSGPAADWVVATPWRRAGSEKGAETDAFVALFTPRNIAPEID